jgi:TonB family protein
MSHSTDIESRPNPDGLQEIRSWASRSPDSVRPGFRWRSRPTGLGRSSSRLAASVLLALLLLSLAGYRFFQNGQGSSDLGAIPEAEPEQAAQIVDGNGEAPPAADAVADIPQARKEPVQASVTPPALPVPEEIPRKEAAATRRVPAPKEPKAASRVVVSRDAFESEPAVLLSTPTAEYPNAARGTGTTAEVIVGFTIDETGAVRDPAVESSRVQGSAPESLFVEEALAAARRARFEPARERGVPTPSWNTLTFSFETGSQPAGS